MPEETNNEKTNEETKSREDFKRDAFRDIFLIYCAITAVVLGFSFKEHWDKYKENEAYKEEKAALISTDLSEVSIGGYKPGMVIGDQWIPSSLYLKDKNGKSYYKSTTYESKTESIWRSYAESGIGVVIDCVKGNIYWYLTERIPRSVSNWDEECSVEYKGKVLDMVSRIDTVSRIDGEGYEYPPHMDNAMVSVLGENYFKDEDSHYIIYRDQEHGLELRLDGNGAELSKADEPLNLEHYLIGYGKNLTASQRVLHSLGIALLWLPAACCLRFRRMKVILPIIAAYIIGAFGFLYYISSIF